MIRILLAVDGSQNSDRAVDYLVKYLTRYKEPAEVHVLNVQAPLPGDVTMLVDREDIKQYHQEQGTKALVSARARLDAAKIRYAAEMSVGDPAQTIAQLASDKHCDEIVMGTRGMGSVAGMLLGSVAAKVVHLSHVPVLLIK